MDMCVIFTELDPKFAEDRFKKAREYLRRFSFIEELNDDYKRAIANTAQNWSKFLKSGLNQAQGLLVDQPYQWLRLAGKIEIENSWYGIQFFLYPLSGAKAAMSIFFSSNLYDAIYSFKTPLEKLIDINVKRDFVALLLMIATSVLANAFALKPLTDPDDLVLPLRIADIHDWLVTPTKDTISRWPFLIVGILAEMVERAQVKWPAMQLKQIGPDFLIYDGIG